MLKLNDDQRRLFAEAVRQAAANSKSSQLDDIYSRFEQERVARAPTCDRSGRCCRFEAYGHRLFVSALEVARFVQQEQGSGDPDWDGTGCPFQAANLCTVHAARPFGCRAYFCDPSSTVWQQDQYERLHREIRELHDKLGVPYLYVEWREALAALQILPKAAVARRSLPVLP